MKPEWKKGWKTYNFEVEKYHTYIAGGIRVHNESELGSKPIDSVDLMQQIRFKAPNQ